MDGVPLLNDTLLSSASRDTSTSKASLLSAVSPNTLVLNPITSLSSTGPQTCIRQPLPTTDAPLSNLGDSVVKYFKAKRVRPDRINRLTRYILSFVKAEVLLLQAYNNLWSNKGKVFAGSENGIRRTCRLQRGRL